ncbi:hypothetical protein [Streptomyces lasiicapitis]|uniref:hypothetical protein n=1 Tax=Streptomyces lasiicapitis TaxID=1923961 RepID=UPI003652B3F9
MSITTAEFDARATEAYAVYMGHLYGCRPCQDGDDCATGARTREAWKTARNASLRARRAAQRAPT